MTPSEKGLIDVFGPPHKHSANPDSLDYIEGYYAGRVMALREFAWWQDGTQLVGNGTHKLNDLLQEESKNHAENLRRHDLLAFGIKEGKRV